MPARADVARGVVLAAHPLPCLAVTAFATAWAAAVAHAVDAGAWPRVALVALAVGLGQLSIGWSNDAVDADRDARAGRGDKPAAVGTVTSRRLWSCALAAALLCVAASLALGPVAACVHLVAVASAWAYNLGLKSTAASPLPYLVSFGLLPSVASTALGAGWAAPAVAAAAALLGVAAHLANTVPDVEADALTGVRGLPQRLGPTVSTTLMALAVAAAAACLLARGVGALAAGILVVAVVVAGASAAAFARGERLRAQAFRVTLAAVALVVVAFVLAGP
ncbi:MAG: UbiA family prenyltransferase [Kineosporiaceae bacterium]